MLTNRRNRYSMIERIERFAKRVQEATVNIYDTRSLLRISSAISNALPPESPKRAEAERALMALAERIESVEVEADRFERMTAIHARMGDEIGDAYERAANELDELVAEDQAVEIEGDHIAEALGAAEGTGTFEARNVNLEGMAESMGDILISSGVAADNESVGNRLAAAVSHAYYDAPVSVPLGERLIRALYRDGLILRTREDIDANDFARLIGEAVSDTLFWNRKGHHGNHALDCFERNWLEPVEVDSMELGAVNSFRAWLATNPFTEPEPADEFVYGYDPGSPGMYTTYRRTDDGLELISSSPVKLPPVRSVSPLGLIEFEGGVRAVAEAMAGGSPEQSTPEPAEVTETPERKAALTELGIAIDDIALDLDDPTEIAEAFLEWLAEQDQLIVAGLEFERLVAWAKFGVAVARRSRDHGSVGRKWIERNAPDYSLPTIGDDADQGPYGKLDY